MLRTIWNVTQHGDDAEEALQEALSVVWRKWDRIRVHPNPKALILRICINAARDVLRKRIRRERRERRAETTIPARPLNPAQALDAQERESTILDAISQLSRNQSAAVVMRLVHGLSYGDIGAALGCRDATARKHVERGRKRLQEILAPLRPSLTEETA
ncbi:MAG TPA: sigma-70 family RNA polymerase sigma factor [Candidatus Hydrogenedentes bacterium]|nr:sigma-70 family RNA polymerase sigma factor [Candidatus Hydrogenedentota bacterium]